MALESKEQAEIISLKISTNKVTFSGEIHIIFLRMVETDEYSSKLSFEKDKGWTDQYLLRKYVRKFVNIYFLLWVI